MPGGSGRAVQINGASDVDYYNVTINNQKFERLNAGASVESSPIAVGAEVRVTVEAIGSIIDRQAPAITGGRVAFFETTRIMENGGINISVKMSDYKTEYHTVTLNTSSFNSANLQYVYVADGSRYTPRNYGVLEITDTIPPSVEKHTGWIYTGSGATRQELGLGQGVTITSDTTFTIQSVSGIEVNFGSVNQQPIEDLAIDGTIRRVVKDDTSTYFVFPDEQFTLPHANMQSTGSGNKTPVTQWEWYDDDQQQHTGAPGDKILATSSVSGYSFWAQ